MEGGNMIKYLHTLHVKRQGPPKLVPSVVGLFGFRSVYGYPDETAEIIELNRSTAGLTGRSVYSDVLLVDFDSQPQAAEELEEYLRTEEYAFAKYDSGNRSIHFHISIEPMEGSWVPDAQRKWINKHAPLADTTIYKPSGLFRLEGTWHEKNPGHKKQCVEAHRGRRLKIERPERQLRTNTQPVSNRELQLEISMNRYRTEGGRSGHVWHLADLAWELGFTEEETFDMVSRWNNRYSTPPLTEERLWEKIDQAYSQRTRR